MEGYISVISRNQSLVVIVWHRKKIIYIVNLSLRTKHKRPSLCKLNQLVHDYNVTMIIIEPCYRYRKYLGQSTSLQLVEISLIEAKMSLLKKKQVTHQDICEHIIQIYPELKRFIPMDEITGKLCLLEWRHKIVLLSVVLGHSFINQNIYLTN